MGKEIELMRKLEKDLKLYKVFLCLLIIYLKFFFFKFTFFDNLNLNIIKSIFVKNRSYFNNNNLIKTFLINREAAKYIFSQNK